MKRKSLQTAAIIFVLIFGLTACISSNSDQQNEISASGTIEADTVRISPEISGKVSKLFVEKGATVNVGDTLFKLDDELLQAKYDQAKAQVAQASAALEVAKQNQINADLQYQLALQTDRSLSGNIEANRWQETTLDEVNLPNWYFQKSETISSLQNEVSTAQNSLADEQNSLQATLEKSSNNEFVNAEIRVNQAQVAFNIADQTLEQANKSKGEDKDTLVDAAQKIYDQAETELNAAQKAYNALLTGTAATDVKEARARVAVADARLQNAQDELDSYLTRDDSLQVEAAKAGVDMAEKSISQAEANLSAAQAAQKEIEVELSKLTVNSPANGVVLSNPVKVGETVSAGQTVFEVGDLEHIKLTVYVTEDQFGKITLGDSATVTVDSFPDEVFDGTVTYISDQAEFTPRNVQTVESRSTTVYAVEIELDNTNLQLKPGMPADAAIRVN